MQPLEAEGNGAALVVKLTGLRWYRPKIPVAWRGFVLTTMPTTGSGDGASPRRLIAANDCHRNRVTGRFRSSRIGVYCP